MTASVARVAAVTSAAAQLGAGTVAGAGPRPGRWGWGPGMADEAAVSGSPGPRTAPTQLWSQDGLEELGIGPGLGDSRGAGVTVRGNPDSRAGRKSFWKILAAGERA